MRRALLTAIFAVSASLSNAQDQGIAAPVAAIANYDPTMSAKEAVLANWELAAAGIRAGRVMAEKVVEMADKDLAYAGVARQALFAQKTMMQRYNAAQWIYTPGTGVTASTDVTALVAAVAAAETPCSTETCGTERAQLREAFARATHELRTAAAGARSALSAREGKADTLLMTEQLSLMADYLEGGTWADGFALTEFHRDTEEVAARIVGTMSLWQNVEPYVGLANPEIDAAINHAAGQLLRTLRKTTRGVGVLDPDGPELTAIRAKADLLAVEFRKAASLFAV